MKRFTWIGIGLIGLHVCTSVSAGDAARPKAIALSGEVRARYDSYDNKQLTPHADARQSLLRGVLGANVRAARHPARARLF